MEHPRGGKTLLLIILNGEREKLQKRVHSQSSAVAIVHLCFSIRRITSSFQSLRIRNKKSTQVRVSPVPNFVYPILHTWSLQGHTFGAPIRDTLRALLSARSEIFRTVYLCSWKSFSSQLILNVYRNDCSRGYLWFALSFCSIGSTVFI